MGSMEQPSRGEEHNELTPIQAATFVAWEVNTGADDSPSSAGGGNTEITVPGDGPDCSGFWDSWSKTIGAVAADETLRPAASPYPDLYGAEAYHESLHRVSEDQVPDRPRIPYDFDGELVQNELPSSPASETNDNGMEKGGSRPEDVSPGFNTGSLYNLDDLLSRRSQADNSPQSEITVPSYEGDNVTGGQGIYYGPGMPVDEQANEPQLFRSPNPDQGEKE